MKYVECPNVWDGVGKSVFLAGGITNCPDWQGAMASLLASTELVVLNPRRRVWPASTLVSQVGWEWQHIRKAWAMSFWFPAGESVCPITLYELGRATNDPRRANGGLPLYVGVELGYPRTGDVYAQIALAMPGVKIANNLTMLTNQIRREHGGWIGPLKPAVSYD